MIIKYLKHKPGVGWQQVNGELTFNRCLIAREFEEPSKAGKLETATTAGAPVSDDKLWNYHKLESCTESR